MQRRPRWLAVSEVAAYWRVHTETVYRAIRRGDLPARRFPSGRIVIDSTVAEEFAAPSGGQQMTACYDNRQQV